MEKPRECLEINERFFKALEELKAMGRIRGVRTFSERYNENYWNFWNCRTTNARIKQEWLTYLVRDYGVSPIWLLTGAGEMFSHHKTHNLTKSKSTIDNDTDKA